MNCWIQKAVTQPKNDISAIKSKILSTAVKFWYSFPNIYIVIEQIDKSCKNKNKNLMLLLAKKQ